MASLTLDLGDDENGGLSVAIVVPRGTQDVAVKALNFSSQQQLALLLAEMAKTIGGITEADLHAAQGAPVPPTFAGRPAFNPKPAGS